MSKLSAKDKRLLTPIGEPRRRNRTVDSPWDEVYSIAAASDEDLSGKDANSAYAAGSTVAVGDVVRVARSYQNDLEKTAAHLCMSALAVQEALRSAGIPPEKPTAAPAPGVPLPKGK